MTGDLILATADASVRRLTSLLRSIDASEAAAVGAWSVRDVAAHLAGGIEAYEPILQRMGSPVAALEELAAYNAEVVASVDERDLGVLATRIDAGFDQARTLAQHLEPSTEISWHGGLRLPVSTLFAAMAGEALVHGYDLARASSRPWPMPAADVRTTIMGLLPLLPHSLVPSAVSGFSACFDLRLRGDRNARALLVFHDGELTIAQPHDRRVDCVISADPATYLLVAYGRIGPIRPALTGKVVAWGRKPYLGLRLNGLFRNP